MPEKQFNGGCLCGAVRYEARGEPLYAGYCYCSDCRKASGSGFIPFIGFAAGAVSFTGATRQFRCKSIRGTDAVRNTCPICASLVFGGDVGIDDSFTLYAGSLDDASLFTPTVAIFMKSRAPWAPVPAGLNLFETLPT